MLTSISPLGEQARGQRYGLTVAAHLLGGALGGATTGLLLGAVGALLGLPVLLAVPVLLLAAVADLRGTRVGRRQVDEDWLGRYRGWVYGGGYGYQLGLGVVTVVTSAATPALLAVLVLTGSPSAGAVLGAVFGLCRGLPLLALRSAHTPPDLRAAAERLERLRRPAARVTVLTLTLLPLVLLVLTPLPPTLAALTLAALTLAALTLGALSMGATS